MAIFMGIAPGIFLKTMEPSVMKVVQMIGQVAP
jgi:hypothetical protein